MRKRVCTWLLFAASCMGPHAALLAQSGASEDRGGRHAAILLELPASARALALGDAATAVEGDASALHYNPAQLAGVLRWSAGMSVQRHLAQSTLGAAAAARRVRGAVWAIGLQALAYGSEAEVACPIAEPDCTAGDSTGRRVSAGDFAISAGVARPIGSLRAGGAVKFVRQEIAGDAGSTVAVDAGLALPLAGGVTLGAALQHAGPSLELAGTSAALPRLLRVGAAVTRRVPLSIPLHVTASADAIWRRDASGAAAGGLELSWRRASDLALHARGGIASRAPGSAARRWSLGGAIQRQRLAFDYAYHDYEFLGSVHRVGVRAWR